MSKNKNNKPIWGTRIKKNASTLFKKVGGSLPVDKRLFKEDIEGSIAHVEMLHKQKIINFRIKNKIIWGLKRIKNEIVKKKFNFDYDLEDIHMNIENRLFELIGDDAGYVHTARSRNDQVITDLKLWLKEATKKIIILLDNTNSNILNLAQKNIRTIMPGFTHLKNAQPLSLAHYLLAYVEMFKRDKKKFKNNLEFLDENPLGVGALSGTSFKIDRNYTTKKLKFKKPTNNSVDTVSDRDFVLDFLYSSLACSLHISRIAEELIIWNSDAFNIINLNDKLVKPLKDKLPKGVFVNISGAASELERTWNSMQQNVLIAIFVIFILLTILMKSFTLPLIVLVIVPSAAVGGIMALIIINLFTKQPLDMLTMLGFIILTGVVVNNSILMVEQTVWHKKYENLKLKNCIMDATKNRIRPIFMSTLTSLFGLTPLLLFPGAGSELYRGIGAVIFGGLTMSTLLTFFMIPPLLMIALRYQKSN